MNYSFYYGLALGLGKMDKLRRYQTLRRDVDILDSLEGTVEGEEADALLSELDKKLVRIRFKNYDGARAREVREMAGVTSPERLSVALGRSKKNNSIRLWEGGHRKPAGKGDFGMAYFLWLLDNGYDII